MLFPEALACSLSALNADRFHAVYCYVHRITLPPSLYSIYSQHYRLDPAVLPTIQPLLPPQLELDFLDYS